MAAMQGTTKSVAPVTATNRYISGPLEEQKLKQLLKHEYNMFGKSLIEPFFQYFWNIWVNWLPYHIAPNALTLLGLMFNISSTALLVFYSPTAREELPLWLCLYSAFALFAYQTLDALDGKQARRTLTSSQLGELFDHGCDAVNTVFVALGFCIAVGLGHHPVVMFIQVFGLTTAFFVVHWMAYNTGRLEFGKIDVTEAQVVVMALYILTGFTGVKAWGIPLPVIGISMSIVQFLVFAICSMQIVFRIITSIANGGAGKNGATIANTSIIFPGIVWSLVVFLGTIVAIKSPTLLYDHPCLYLYAYGMVGVKITHKLIIAHMTKSELQMWDEVLLAPGILVLNQYFNFVLPETPLLWMSALVATLDTIIFSTRVCRQIAAYLGIMVLHIVPTIDGVLLDSHNSFNQHTMNLRSRPKKS